MKLTILVENQTSRTNNKLCASEWGFSAFLEIKNINILFDSGHSDIYKKNAKNLGIDLEKTDVVILSHYHWDHAKGLLHHEFKTKKKLILHPHVLEKITEEEATKFKNDFEIISTEEVLEFSPDIFFLGQIPRVTPFEKGMAKGEHMFDDTALAIKTDNGVVVLTGCSHSGIANICKYATKITEQKLYAALGGFHLFETDPKGVAGAIEYFKKEKPKHLYPMHCIDLPTLASFYNEFGIIKYGAGDTIEIE